MEKLFRFDALGTNIRTEVRAGFTTFLTMSYIVLVNPGILSETGMPFAGLVTATVVVAALGSIGMGLLANLPFAIAPGMGLNAFFAFTLVLGGVMNWQTALGAVFIAGFIFLLLSVLGFRQAIANALPTELRYGIAAGIGVFLAFIGLQWAGIVVDNPATLVGFSGLSVNLVIFMLGLFLTAWFLIRKKTAALIYGIVFTLALCFVADLLNLSGAEQLVVLPSAIVSLPSFELFGAMELLPLLSWGAVMPIFSIFFTDMFDSLSTFVSISEVGGFIDKKTGEPRNIKQALLADALATTLSGFFGTSSGTTFIESVAGVREGGRSGLSAVVTGLCFIPFLFFAPLLATIPRIAIAPIMILVGLFMCSPLLKIQWDRIENSLPAFISFLIIPLTYSITQGIVWGLLSFSIIKVLTGQIREIHPLLWCINAMCVISLIA